MHAANTSAPCLASASCAEPKLLAQLSSKVVAQVVCGQSHSLALTEFGDVYSWGRGFEGQLGLDVQEVALCPKYVYAFHGTPIAQLAAGGNHSAALSGVGKVYCWGEALSGQVGTGRKSAVTSPALIEGLPAVKSISAGFNHTSALTEAGQMYSWGVASHGPTAAAQPDRFVPQLLPASQETPLSQASAASLRLPRQHCCLPHHRLHHVQLLPHALLHPHHRHCCHHRLTSISTTDSSSLGGERRACRHLSQARARARLRRSARAV